MLSFGRLLAGKVMKAIDPASERVLEYIITSAKTGEGFERLGNIVIGEDRPLVECEHEASQIKHVVSQHGTTASLNQQEINHNSDGDSGVQQSGWLDETSAPPPKKPPRKKKDVSASSVPTLVVEKQEEASKGDKEVELTDQKISLGNGPQEEHSVTQSDEKVTDDSREYVTTTSAPVASPLKNYSQVPVSFLNTVISNFEKRANKNRKSMSPRDEEKLRQMKQVIEKSRPQGIDFYTYQEALKVTCIKPGRHLRCFSFFSYFQKSESQKQLEAGRKNNFLLSQ